METEKTESKFTSFMEKNGKTIKKVLIITGAAATAILVGAAAYAVKNPTDVTIELLTEEDYTPSISESVDASTE